MTMLLDEEELPSELDTRAWLFLDVDCYVISDDKQQALIDSIHSAVMEMRFCMAKICRMCQFLS